MKCMCEYESQKLRRWWRCAPQIITKITKNSALSSYVLKLLIDALLLESLKLRTKLLLVTGESVQPSDNQLLPFQNPANIILQLLQSVWNRGLNWSERLLGSWRWLRSGGLLRNSRWLGSGRLLGARGGSEVEGMSVSISRSLLSELVGGWGT